MSIYEYRCPKCEYPIEIVLPIDERDNPQICLCGEVMMRIMSIPRPPIMKSTSKGMALESLNSKDTSHMKPETKMAAAKGLENPAKKIY